MTCACTITTSLFDLCPACADKAWAYANAVSNRPVEYRGQDNILVGGDIYTRTQSGTYRNTSNKEPKGLV